MNETIVKHKHEEAQTAIDREVHQDHYHTSVQPVKDREVLPEQHQHNIIPVEHREHQHGNPEAIKARLEQERLQFQNTRSQGSTHESHSVAPVIAGEHVHHHVHEVILPPCQFSTYANPHFRPSNLSSTRRPSSHLLSTPPSPFTRSTKTKPSTTQHLLYPLLAWQILRSRVEA